MVVHPHRAELERSRHAHRATDVARPDARGEAVVDVVRPRERLVLVGDALHGDHRAEDLALDDLAVLRGVHDDRRLVEEAGAVDAPRRRS